MLERHSFISKLITYIVIILFFSAIFLVIYAPVIQKDFYYKDDYIYLKAHGDGDPSTLFEIAFHEGRVVNGLFLYYISSHIISHNSAKAIRLIGIIGMVLFASVMWAILKQSRFRSDHAFLISTLICMLPCMQMYILYLNDISYNYSALLSSLSALIIFNVISKKDNKGRKYEIIGVLTAIFLLVTSLTIFQSATMMYWAFGVIFILIGENDDFLKKYHRPLVKYFFVGLVSMAIYFLVFIKIVPFIMNLPVERGHLVPIHRIPIKLAKFIIIAFNNAINLWNIHPNYIFTIFFGLIILIGITFSLHPENKEKNQLLVRNRRQKHFLIFCLLILSYLPSLIVAEDAYTYRTYISFGAALCILFCLGVVNIVEFFKFIPNFSPESRKTTITVLFTALVIVTALMARYNAVHWQSPVQPDIYIWEKWHIG
jgi:hypothetical protein